MAGLWGRDGDREEEVGADLMVSVGEAAEEVEGAEFGEGAAAGASGEGGVGAEGGHGDGGDGGILAGFEVGEEDEIEFAGVGGDLGEQVGGEHGLLLVNGLQLWRERGADGRKLFGFCLVSRI